MKSERELHMAKSKFFRVAVEGETVDGRKIERNWLTEAAASYNPATYAARVNMEHIRGITADKPFKAFGDVLALKAEEVDLELGGKTERKMALFAEIEPTDELLAMNRDKQKLYTSIEIAPSFANTKKAYMVGLAVTDSPASLGTERLTFAVKHPDVTQFQPKPMTEGNVFSLGLETSFELVEGDAPASDPAGITAAIKHGFAQLGALFSKGLEQETPPAPPPADPPAPANDNNLAAFASAIGDQVALAITNANAPILASIAKVTAEVDQLKSTIDTTEQQRSFRRAPASGGGSEIVTNC